jgi:hypothetical protein
MRRAASFSASSPAWVAAGVVDGLEVVQILLEHPPTGSDGTRGEEKNSMESLSGSRMAAPRRPAG